MKLSQAVPELPVANLTAAIAHYRDVLGFTVAWENDDGRIAGLSRGDCTVFLREGRDVAPHVLWVFATDLDEAYASFQDNGARIIAPLEVKPWGLRQFSLADVDGHVIHVHHDV